VRFQSLKIWSVYLLIYRSLILLCSYGHNGCVALYELGKIFHHREYISAECLPDWCAGQDEIVYRNERLKIYHW
jgi:hypothetical protein